jgi:pilus assembly protein CpaE
MRVLVATDSDRSAQRVWETLSRHGIECTASPTVGLDLAADRASRIVPELLVLILPPDPRAGLDALRETCQTVRNSHVLVVGPATDPKLILDVLRTGAAEYLDEAALETELAAALVRAKAKRACPAESRPGGKVVGILGPSGGSGASMVAASLSAALAGQHGSCGLIDLRLAAGDLASMFDLNPAHTIADLCDRLSRVDQSMFEQFLARHPSGVHLLAAPREFAEIEKITGKGVRRALAMGRVRFPYVVVEVDNAFGKEQVEALWQADAILLVLRLDYTSVRNARRAMDHLVELGIGLDQVQLVANGYRQRRQLRVSQAEQALDMRILHYVPNDPAQVNRAINKGVPVALHRPSCSVAKSIMELAASVNGRPR